ncbi:MAG: 6-carboxytetrahydropterin synthase QueD [Actinobacteria bacterium]|nr:6-carboxytetrahydropterin synthase QueD [Actinomycetota bacterium]
MKVIVYTDGASRGNPGPAAIGGVILTEDMQVLEKFSEIIGQATNNQAEYQAVIEALNRAKKYKPDEVEIRTDSELIVRQISGQYKVNSETLKGLLDKINNLSSSFNKVKFVHVKREENSEADRLCNRALDLSEKKNTPVKGKFLATAIGKFDCAHFLRDYEGKCAKLHGHTYKVEVSVYGTSLNKGMLIDLVELKKSLKEVLQEFDHKYLNELDYFKEISPTAENLCILIAEKMNEKMPPNVRVEYVKVYESDDSFISYYPSLR